MSHVRTDASPLHVAIVGAGPAGFYAAECLLRHDGVAVDLFDRLPTPFGLVRSGVAPDHQKIKNVTRVFERVADHPRFRFFGNVCFGEHLTLADVAEHYHQVLFTTGAQTDRSLGIPGEDLPGSHSATEFVAWYNGHPEFRDCAFDLRCERAVVVGVGNVAVDVARILCRTPDELAATDIADYALDALRESRVREVVLLGRRGPLQAAFTYPEVKELGEMEDADVLARPEEVALDPLSEAELEAAQDRQATKQVALLQDYAERSPSGKRRRIVLRFLVSPTEILGNDRVEGVRIVRNELVDDGSDRLRPRPTGETEEIEAGLVFRSVGYRGVALTGVPFDERRGIVPNEGGRVTDADGTPIPGLYVAGWIKRGPSGVIGTNKPDAHETANAMLEDADRGVTLGPAAPDAEAAERLVRTRQPACFDYADWRRLDAHEVALGEAAGRPRVKLTSVEDMLATLRRTPRAPA
ncbi:MAG: FAD-dependent oxidoreductase [Rhodothermales bacterium]